MLPALGSIFLISKKNMWCGYLFCLSIMLKQNIVIAVLVLKQCYLHWGQYFLISIKSLWCCYLLHFSIMLSKTLLLQFWCWSGATCIGVNKCPSRAFGVVTCFVLALCSSIVLKQNIVIAVLVLRQCYLHWGQYFLISIKSLWCCYLFCFSIMLKQSIVIAVLVLQQCYLHWGQ